MIPIMARRNGLFHRRAQRRVGSTLHPNLARARNSGLALNWPSTNSLMGIANHIFHLFR
jgi:hypothetical protein